MATRVLDARASRLAISSICCITCSVRSQRRRVGQLHVDQQIALVLRRDEAGRRRA